MGPRLLILMAWIASCSPSLPTIQADEARCGDAVVDTNEACDDGNEDNTDSCTDRCEFAACGDGYVQRDERCDDGNFNDRDGCTNVCEPARCGDAIWRQDLNAEAEGFEACDDGNLEESDGCTTLCAPPRCGDGITQTDEACDDGNTIDSDACRNTCVAATCGDSVTRADVVEGEDGYEACDGGENCSEDCRLVLCGNGIAEPGEACDDGNTIDTDACIACALARCGDGHLYEGAEACDDGNLDPGDSCSVDCRIDDHGNTFDTATPLALVNGTSRGVFTPIVNAQINPSDDIDLFVLTAPSTGVYRFTTTRPVDDPRGDPVCRVFDAAFNLAGFMDDLSLAQTPNDLPSNFDCSVELRLQEGQRGFFEVGSFGSRNVAYNVEVQTPCGNGVLDPGEECDPQSPQYNPFRCRTDCRLRRLISLAGSTGCAVVDGAVKCWGSNSSYLLGENPERHITCAKDGHDRTGRRLGSYNVDVVRFPVEVIPASERVKDLTSSGLEQVCALSGVTNLPLCWGRLLVENLGGGSISEEGLRQCQDDEPPRWEGIIRGACHPEPVVMGDLYHNIDWEESSVLDRLIGITVGTNSKCLISRGGHVYCSGYMRFGLQGDQISMERQIASQSDYNHWPAPSLAREAVMPANEMAEYVALGEWSACALLGASQRLACWGKNNYGQTGSGRSTTVEGCEGVPCEPTPVLVDGDLGEVVSLSVGQSHGCAVNGVGHAFCWGLNAHGQTGSPSDESACDDLGCVRRPTRVAGLEGVIDIVAGTRHSCALTQNGGVWCWGDNALGQLGMGVLGGEGRGQPDFRVEPVRVGRLGRMVGLAAGPESNCARAADGNIFCWGANGTGQLGTGECTEAEPFPLAVDLR